jgi:hypothetical protein
VIQRLHPPRASRSWISQRTNPRASGLDHTIP